MAYKTILVQLNDEQRVEQTLAPAVALAARFGAHLIGLHVSPGLMYVPPLPSAGRVIGMIKEHERKICDTIGKAFEEMTRNRGFVAETNATHIFVVRNGEVLTPRLVACPEGITRDTVLQLCRDNGIPHAERDLSLTEIYRADEMFCTGTMGELAAVVDVDGRPIGDSQFGPMTARLSELFTQLTRTEGTVLIADAPAQ